MTNKDLALSEIIETIKDGNTTSVIRRMAWPNTKSFTVVIQRTTIETEVYPYEQYDEAIKAHREWFRKDQNMSQISTNSTTN